MRKNKSKGDRLNWTPLKDVKSVRLSEELTKGKRVIIKVVKENSNNTLLVP